MPHRSKDLIPYDHNTLFPQTSSGAFQWWYFDAEFEQGYSACLVLLPFTIGGGLGDRNQNASMVMNWVTLCTPEGETRTARQLYSGAEFTSASKGLDARAGETSIRFDGKSYLLNFKESDLAADLVVTPVIPPWTPLPGVSHRNPEELEEIAASGGDLFFDYVQFMPRGDAVGTLTIQDKTVTVNGIGYHEQGFGNRFVGQIMESWYWTKYYLDEYTFAVMGSNPGEEARSNMGENGAIIEPRSFYLAKDNRIVGENTDVTNTLVKFECLEEETIETGVTIPTRVKVHAENGNTAVDAEISFISMREVFPFAYPEEGYSPRVKQPTWLQYVSGIEANIDIDGNRVTKKGRGIYELMFAG